MKRKFYLPLLIVLLASLVFGVFPLGQGVAYASPGWVSPTGNVANGWSNPTNPYDEDTGTSASYEIPKNTGWSPYLELTRAEVQCDKVRVWSERQTTDVDNMEVDVYYSGGWHNISTGSITVGSFVEFAIGSEQAVTAMRVRYYNSSNGRPSFAYVNEADFNDVLPPDISNDSATGNSYNFGTVDAGSITETGLAYFTVTNNSAYTVSITISGSDMADTGEGVTWTLSNDASIGENIYGLNAGRATENYNIIIKKSSPNYLVENLAGLGGTQQWGLQFLAPSTFTDGGTKSGTVTLTATQA